jgi:hypothetical protein
MVVMKKIFCTISQKTKKYLFAERWVKALDSRSWKMAFDFIEG